MGRVFKKLWFKVKQMHKRRKLKRKKKRKKRESQSGRRHNKNRESGLKMKT
jgi:hypothetical protein